MLNLICVNRGDYLGRGKEYVAKLLSGIVMHLSLPFTFHFETDGPGEGWWAKLSLFKPGKFQGRCLYFDLDTVILGSLDDMAAYKGKFAALSDFYHPKRLASGVMAWEAGEADVIWKRWRDAGFPQFNPRGDQGWIEAVMPRAERLQTLFPEQIVSFKADCMEGVPERARVVCFHGQPRPHVLSDLISNW